MSNHDWQSALQGLLDSSSLPQGEESAADSSAAPEKGTGQKGRLAIAYEKKGRGGKQVTIVSGFNIDNEALNDVAATLKRKLGTGGSARGGEILIQGDRRTEVKQLLTSMGFKL